MSRLRPFMIMCWRKIPSNVNPRRCAARRERRIQRVALPLVPPIPQRFEDITREQIHRLRGTPRSLKRRRVDDAADLDHAMNGLDAHERSRAEGGCRRGIDYGEVQRIGPISLRAQRPVEGGTVVVGSVEQVQPQGIVVPRTRRKQRVALRGWVERY